MGLTFKKEPLLLAHPLNGTCILNTTNVHLVIQSTLKKWQTKKNGLNILVANVTNLIATYLEWLPNIYFILA
jgi:hypothetical protein